MRGVVKLWKLIWAVPCCTSADTCRLIQGIPQRVPNFDTLFGDGTFKAIGGSGLSGSGGCPSGARRRDAGPSLAFLGLGQRDAAGFWEGFHLATNPGPQGSRLLWAS